MLYVMFSNLSKQFTPWFGWLETTNLPPTNLTPMMGAAKSSCTPMFTFFMELLRRRRGKMESDEKGIAEKRIMVKERQWHENVLYSQYIYMYIICIHIACYVYITMIYVSKMLFNIQSSMIVWVSGNINKFWWFCHQEHFKTRNVSCVYGFLCVRWRVAVCNLLPFLTDSLNMDMMD